VRFDGPGTLFAAALLLGVVNAVIRPIAIVLTLPLTLVTLGLFLLVINAAMLGLVALLLAGFQISGFWTALGASLVVGVTSWIASGLIGNNGRFDVLTIRKNS
jgi:putative membrane protein